MVKERVVQLSSKGKPYRPYEFIQTPTREGEGGPSRVKKRPNRVRSGRMGLRKCPNILQTSKCKILGKRVKIPTQKLYQGAGSPYDRYKRSRAAKRVPYGCVTAAE